MIGGHECFSLRRAVKFTTMAAMLLGLMRRQLNAALVLVLFAVMTLLGLTLLWPFASDLSVSVRWTPTIYHLRSVLAFLYSHCWSF